MAKRSRSMHAKKIRRLQIQSLQRREMMAADCYLQAFSQASVNETVSVVSTSAVAANTDPGSSLSTALNLGSVESSVSAQGLVYFGDRVDLYRFEIGRDGAVDIDLTDLSRNVDLVLLDDSGSVIDSSRNRGRSSETISSDVEAGTYFVGIRTRSFWGSQYQLSLDVQLSALQPAIDPEPVPAIDPASEPALDDSGPLTPLADVQYFGGSREWNVNAVNAPEAWAAGFSGEGVTIAVVDTGVDLDHPDLVDNLFVNSGEIRGNGIDDDGNGYVDDVNGYDFAGRDADPNDVRGHGTHVAGTIAAGLNSFGATGVAPDATILPVRVLGNDGFGSTSAVAAGIRYAADLGADIINLSLGGGYSRSIQSAIDYANNLGSFIVAAAGNEAASTPGFPAQFSSIYDNVLSVGAHNTSNQIAGFSNDVGTSGSVQVDAPGVGVFSTYAGGRYANLSGTSMAAPNAAGVAALALSANPDLTPSQLRDLLVGGITDAAIGSDSLGIVNAATTVAFAAAGLTASPVNSTASSPLTARSNASFFRAISVDGPVATSDFLNSAQNPTSSATLTQANIHQVESTVDAAGEQKQAIFLVATDPQSDSVEIVNFITEDQSEAEPDTVDAAFGDDSFNALA